MGLCAGLISTAAAQETEAQKRGEEIAAQCVVCHGQQGNSTVPAFPKLAGQNEKYLLKQLKDMKKGLRPVPEMSAMLANLSDQNLNDLAIYYSKQAITLEGADPKLVELGEKLYRGGNLKTQVSACSACHGPQGKGMSAAGFPALSGQHANYTVAQLKAFRTAAREDQEGKKRENDPGSMMRSISKNLTDAEIIALSSYLSGLH